jgi:hypothetical protein
MKSERIAVLTQARREAKVERYRLVLLGIAATVVGLFGCGSSSSDTSEGEVLTKAQFINQADQICRKMEYEQAKGFAMVSGGDPSVSRHEIATKAGLPPLQKAIARLERLAPPKGNEEAAEAVMEAMDEALAVLEQNPDAIYADVDDSPFQRANELASQLGLTECSQAP